MHGDYSRDSYDATKQFARVLMQQGRLIVDADWNEQSAILLQQIRNLTTDLIGWHGGPGVTKDNNNSPKAGALAIIIHQDKKSFMISGGRYYIDGIAYEWQTKDEQNIEDFIAFLGLKTNHDPNQAVLVYADIYERLVVSAEDPTLLDPGLNGLDTMARQTVVGKLRGTIVKGSASSSSSTITEVSDLTKFTKEEFFKLNADLKRSALPQLKAFTKRDQADPVSCDPSDNSGFTGFENQLYRIEVHTVLDKHNNKIFGNATFKWSRDNGSIAYAGTQTGDSVKLKSKWRDDSKAIQKGNYVELIAIGDDFGDLLKVVDVIENDGVIELRTESGTSDQSSEKPERSVIVRRWDHQDRPNSTPIDSKIGGFTVEKGEDDTSIEFPIEDGLFAQVKLSGDATFKPGDHWLIPARSSTGDILWPRDPNGAYSFIPARCIEHHYAPIALLNLKLSDNNSALVSFDLRKKMTLDA